MFYCESWVFGEISIQSNVKRAFQLIHIQNVILNQTQLRIHFSDIKDTIRDCLNLALLHQCSLHVWRVCVCCMVVSIRDKGRKWDEFYGKHWILPVDRERVERGVDKGPTTRAERWRERHNEKDKKHRKRNKWATRERKWVYSLDAYKNNHFNGTLSWFLCQEKTYSVFCGCRLKTKLP